MARWLALPWPNDATVTLFGLARACATSSAMLVAANDGCATTIIGEATRAAVDSLVGQLVAVAPGIPETKVAIKALVADVAGAEVIINLGSSGGVKVGAEYEVTRPGREVRDPATGRVLRRITTRVGTLKITSADEQSATGTMTGGPAMVGDCVGACPGGN